MPETDGYGNVLPRGTRQQLNREQATYRDIARQLERAAEDHEEGPDPTLCEYCKDNPREPGLPCCDNSICKARHFADQEDR
jgi:hypothetical protein